MQENNCVAPLLKNHSEAAPTTIIAYWYKSKHMSKLKTLNDEIFTIKYFEFSHRKLLQNNIDPIELSKPIAIFYTHKIKTKKNHFKHSL